MRKDNRRRAILVAVVLAAVLILTKSVTTLADLVVDKSLVANVKSSTEIIWPLPKTESDSSRQIPPSVLSLRLAEEFLLNDTFKEDGILSSGNIRLWKLNGDGDRITREHLRLIEQQEDIAILASDIPVSQIGAGSTLTLVGNLYELNRFKQELVQQLEALADRPSIDAQEQQRLEQQLTLVNRAIDDIINQPQSQNLPESDSPGDAEATLPNLTGRISRESLSSLSPATGSNLTLEQPATAAEEAPATNSDDTDTTTADGDDRSSPQLASVVAPNTNPLQIHLLNVLKWACYFIATIAGIFFKALWDSADAKSLLKLNNLKPILIAPIVFYSVYATIQTLSDSLLAVLIAFQNGFFWQSILHREERRFGPTLAEQPSPEEVKLS